MNSSNKQYLGVAIAVLSANLFSSKVLLVKMAYSEGAMPMQVLGIRMATALPFFLVMTIFLLSGKGKARPSRWDFLVMSMLGLLGYYISSILDFYGIQHVTAGMERLLLYLYPSFLVVIKCVAENKLPRPIEILAMTVAYSGIALFYRDEHRGSTGNVLLGSVLILGAGVSFAFYLYLSLSYIQKFGSRLFASYSTLVSCIAVLVHASLVGAGGNSAVSGTVVLLCVLTGIFCTVVPTYLMHYSISLVGSSKFSILGTSGILCPLFLGILLLGEPLTLSRLGGTFMVLVAVILLGREKPEHKPVVKAPGQDEIELLGAGSKNRRALFRIEETGN